MAPTESCSHKEVLPTDCLNISREVTQRGLWRVTSRLQRCPCLVITGLYLLPRACSSSSIGAFAASPPSRLGKQPGMGGMMLARQQPVRRELKGQTQTGTDGGLRRRSYCQSGCHLLSSSHEAWGAQLANTLFYIQPFETIELQTKITKTNPDGVGMEVKSIKLLNEDRLGGNSSSSRTDLELFIAPEWCTVKSLMEANIEDYTANPLWQPCCHWLLKDQSVIQKRAEGTHSVPIQFQTAGTANDASAARHVRRINRSCFEIEPHRLKCCFRRKGLSTATLESKLEASCDCSRIN